MKVWDKVRCIEWVWEYLTKWKIYTIIKINDQEFPRVIDNDWDDNWFSKDKFELVQEDKLPHELIWLDRYRVVKKDESDPLWELFFEWFNKYYHVDYDDSWDYFWHDWSNIGWWTDAYCDIEDFENSPTLITLAERDRCVNKKSSQTKQLSEKYTYTNQVLRSDWVLFTPDEVWGEKVSDIKERYNKDRSLLRKHKDLFGN